MTSVLLIRHGQASFGAQDYDCLCERGLRQCEILGQHLQREGRVIAGAFFGTLRRQAETAHHVMTSAGWDLPVTSNGAFDEYDSRGLFEAYLPVAAQRDPDIADIGLVRRDRRLFQKALAGVTELWLSGASGFAGESWSDFQGRIRAGLEAAVSQSRKDDVIAVFTSGGVIAAAVGDVLGMQGRDAIALSWRIHNCSVTEILYGRNGFSLSGFNNVSHLRLSGVQDILTYR